MDAAPIVEPATRLPASAPRFYVRAVAARLLSPPIHEAGFLSQGGGGGVSARRMWPFRGHSARVYAPVHRVGIRSTGPGQMNKRRQQLAALGS